MPGAVHGKTLNIITRLAHGANGTAARRAELEAFDRLAPREQEHQAMFVKSIAVSSACTSKGM